MFGLFIYSTFSFGSLGNNLKKVEDSTLWLNPVWLKLVHYEKSFISGNFKSAISSKDFFLAPDGRKSPRSELIATLRHFDTDANRTEGEKAICRFPARYTWLASKLDLKELSTELKLCQKFQKWSDIKTVKSISLLFATGYFSNPASFFGHPLLKINRTKEKHSNYLLDESINYGAKTPDNPNPILYVLYGLMGGYKAGFSSADFFYSNHNYTEQELRDLWEYELELTDEQSVLFISHIWELLGKNFPYFFFSDNCGYRVAELLELVTGKKINKNSGLYAVPHELYDKVFKYGLAKKVVKINSRQTNMVSSFKTLKREEKKVAKKILKNKFDLQSPQFQNINTIAKIRILDFLANYYSFRKITDKDETFKKKRIKVLVERSKLPIRKTELAEVKSYPPHLGQNPLALTTQLQYGSDLGEIVGLRLRPAYYDLLSPKLGRYLNSELRILDFSILTNQEQVWLDYVDIFSVTSLNISQTGLKADGGFAWRLRLRGSPKNIECLNCLNFNLSPSFGKAFQLGHHVIFTFLEGQIESNSNSETFSVAPNLGLILNFSDSIRSRIEYKNRFYIGEVVQSESLWDIELRFGKSKYWDFSLNYNNQLEDRYGLNISTYW